MKRLMQNFGVGAGQACGQSKHKNHTYLELNGCIVHLKQGNIVFIRELVEQFVCHNFPEAQQCFNFLGRNRQ